MTYLQKDLLRLTLFCLVLLVSRFVITRGFGYYFLVWNLFLAYIPLLFSVLAFGYKKFRFLFIGLWFLFYPNAPYIVTDYIHIRSAETLFLRVFDFSLVTLFSLVALILGIRSLQLVLELHKFSKVNKYIIAAIISFIASLGVYIGRIFRFNSWDGFLNPYKVISTILDINNIKHTLFLTVLMIFTVFILNFVTYVIVEEKAPVNLN